MEYISIILIALGLSIDSFAVSVSCGLNSKVLKMVNIIKAALIFGLLQALMTIIGWSVGLGFKKYITGMDHWIAFTLLAIIGIKMIVESFAKNEGEDKKCDLKFSTLIILGIATSIDALAVGISFAFLNIPIINAALIIGAVTILFSSIGFVAGNKVGHLFEKGIEIFGGLVLIGIGAKILIEHLGLI
ncbi:MAG: manganese efflux pump MntP family protein [Candidatus Gracilibacteria bacterium]|jgi:putative Mn2+ efflux pump MntP